MLTETPPRIALWTDVGRNDSAGEVSLLHGPDGTLSVALDCTQSAAVTYIAIRWNELLPKSARILGDHWERGYGDLAWCGVVPERPLPWYAIVYDSLSETTHGVGVETGASSLASWRIDESGVTLLLDVRSGGLGVRLNGRMLIAATVIERNSEVGERPFAFAKRFCKVLCKSPRLPLQQVYGGNDWYFRYGKNSAETVRRDFALLRSLSPSADNAPTFVIDAGWSPGVCDGGPYTHGTSAFPDMPGLADEMRDAGVRPGIWIRPLLMTSAVPTSWQMPAAHPHSSSPGHYLDPSIPEVLDLVREDISRLKTWGYGLIKHDFTTYDILGRWGFEMGGNVTSGAWTFADQSKTSAEIILNLYRTIRQAAGDSLLIGCNTVGHLGAGLFELQRTGDDTSGHHFERTRKMGVNSLAFRMPQHNAFFAADADCVGLTDQIPWEQNELWLDLLARSGTPLFVSADPDIIGPDQSAALRKAFALAAVASEPAEPLDWMQTTCPRTWRFGEETRVYGWPTFPDSALPCPA